MSDKNDLLRRQDCIEAIEGITCSMSLCVNADECHGMKRMQRQAVLEIANMPAAQPDHVADISKKAEKEDCISRQAAIDAVDECFKKAVRAGNMSAYEYDSAYTQGEIDAYVTAIDTVKTLPAAQPELTDEQSIAHLQSSGWIQRHDKEMYESGLKEQLADDSDSYDSLLPAVHPEVIRCKNCEHWKNGHLCERLSRFGSFETKADFYCGYAERKINERTG